MFFGLIHELRELSLQINADRRDRAAQTDRLVRAIGANTMQMADLVKATNDLASAFAALAGTSGEPAVATWHHGMREPE